MSTARIAIAYDCLYPFTTGGGERLYRSYADHMSLRAVAVDYLTAQQWPDGEAPDEAAFRVVPVTGRLRLYDEAGVRRTSVALRFAWGLFRALVRRRRSYDAVVVSGLPVLNVFAARAALLGSRTRLVVDYLEVWGRRQWREYAGPAVGMIAWMLQRLAVALTPTATCHSQLTARQLRVEGMRRRILLSPGLIDGESPHAFVPEAAAPPYAVYVGRHIPDKRVEAVPPAVAHARRTIADLGLVVLGSGPSTAEVEAAVKAAGGDRWTRRPGFVPQEQLDDLMANAAVLVNPSRREGYGLVVVEASAHGTPVVLVDDPGNAATELVEPDVNGVVAASASASDLGAAIVQAVQAGPPLRRRARSWYDTAIKTRTVERTVGGILAELGIASPAPTGADAHPADSEEGPK
ncbi:glycosyltransferase family 4 protein [Microbacterium timonense]|uniref:glycosyltransferase family 4 protein n=1 Tax=Microbacterium timonense TaxID=2086576 RepID=UPI000D100759|nr:glycosyltransferase [Microbacterium timonense]